MRPRPWMAEREIELLDALFEERKPARVLEFGSGGSTLYWPTRLPFVETWVAVEHNNQYARAVRARANGKTTVLLVQRETRAYVYPPSLTEQTFDLVFVDGVNRITCLKAAAERYLAPGGLAVLHDAARPQYAPAWGFFDHAERVAPGVDEGLRSASRGLAIFWNSERGLRK